MSHPPIEEYCPPSQQAAREVIPPNYVGARHTGEFDVNDHRIAGAYARLTKSIERGESPLKIAALQADLDRIREEVADEERRETELASIRSAVERKKAAAAIEAKVQAGVAAVAKARAESGYVMTLEGAGIRVEARPSVLADVTLRQTVVTSMQTAALVLQRFEEDRIFSARFEAQGHAPKPARSQEWLLNQLADLLRVGVRHEAVSIAANRGH